MWKERNLKYLIKLLAYHDVVGTKNCLFHIKLDKFQTTQVT